MPGVPAGSHVSPRVPRYPRRFPGIPGDSQVSPRVPRCPHGFPGVPAGAQVSPCRRVRWGRGVTVTDGVRWGRGVMVTEDGGGVKGEGNCFGKNFEKKNISKNV